METNYIQVGEITIIMKTYIRLNDVISNKPSSLNSWILERYKELHPSISLKDFYLKITICFIDLTPEISNYRRLVSMNYGKISESGKLNSYEYDKYVSKYPNQQ